MNIIYMGTPEFAVKAFEAIVEAGHHVTACFTQPDKPKGRGKNTVPTPVKERHFRMIFLSISRSDCGKRKMKPLFGNSIRM